MTNFDVIKQMTVAELGKFLNHIDCSNCSYHEVCCDGNKDCKDGITEWLGQEASWWMSDYNKGDNV